MPVSEGCYHHRAANGETQHEDNTKRSAANPSFYLAHKISISHHDHLLRADQQKSETRDSTGSPSPVSGNVVGSATSCLRVSMQGLVAWYGLELFNSSSRAGIIYILGDVFDRAPLPHASGMFAKLADTTAFAGIYRKLNDGWRSADERNTVQRFAVASTLPAWQLGNIN